MAPTSSPQSAAPTATRRHNEPATQYAELDNLLLILHRPAAPRHGTRSRRRSGRLRRIGQRMAHRTAVGHRPARHRERPYAAAARWTRRSIEEASCGTAERLSTSPMPSWRSAPRDRAALLRFIREPLGGTTRRQVGPPRAIGSGSAPFGWASRRLVLRGRVPAKRLQPHGLDGAVHPFQSFSLVCHGFEPT